jgi:hypothetical protein
VRFVKAFFQFWYDFIIGDDWKIAAAVVVALAAGAAALLTESIDSAALPLFVAIGLGAAFAASLLIDTNPRG